MWSRRRRSIGFPVTGRTHGSGDTDHDHCGSIPADAVLVAIDFAKVRNEVLIDAPGHKRRRRLQVLNNRDRLVDPAGVWPTRGLQPRSNG
jgi:hypothetical protein